eukprot:4769858-Pleurochrysis_carterae.AAC.1
MQLTLRSNRFSVRTQWGSQFKNVSDALFLPSVKNEYWIEKHTAICCAGGVDDGALNAATMAVLCRRQRQQRSATSSDGDVQPAAAVL